MAREAIYLHIKKLLSYEYVLANLDLAPATGNGLAQTI